MTPEDAIVALHKSSSRRTICEVHREIYDAAETCTDPAVKAAVQALVIEAFIMSKAIVGKLVEYKADWDENFYQKNPDRRADRHRRQKP